VIYLLDTNACICFLGGRSVSLRRRLGRTKDRDMATCSVVKAELSAGAWRSNHPARTLSKQRQFLGRFRSFPFDDRAAEQYGREHAMLAILGTPIGPLDLQIAAIALVNDLTLVTHNTREFARISGLKLEDWEASGP